MNKVEEERGQGAVTSWVPFDLKDWIDNEAKKRKWTRSQFVAEALKMIRDRGEEVS